MWRNNMYNFVINQNSNHQECEKVIGILEKK